jgi:LysR family transcriptional regulator, regulator for bpeEF and oprC
VETGSFSGTARAMGVSPAAVSAALSRLEAKLAVRLLDRTTRRLSPTAEGAEFYTRCKQIIQDLEEAELTVGRVGREPSGCLRVGMPSALGRLWIVPQLAGFSRRYPSVTLEVIFSDFVPATIGEGLDLSVQVGELHASSLTVRKLAAVRYVVCAAPGYLARGFPRTPADLARHACLAYRRPRNGRVREWRFGDGSATGTVKIDAPITFNSGEALVAAAAAGLGIIQVAEYYAHPMLRTGELVEILADYQTAGHDISMLYPQQRPVAPKLRVFAEFLLSLFNPPPWARALPLAERHPHTTRG